MEKNESQRETQTIHIGGSNGIGVNQGQVKTEKLAGTINEAESKSLADAATEIQDLLQQLEQSNPTKTTVSGKMAVATQAIEIIETNPNLRQRVLATLKSAGTEAFKEALDHPMANILVAAFEGWIQP